LLLFNLLNSSEIKCSTKFAALYSTGDEYGRTGGIFVLQWDAGNLVVLDTDVAL